jgi:quinol monooxygenase YgiN
VLMIEGLGSLWDSTLQKGHSAGSELETVGRVSESAMPPEPAGGVQSRLLRRLQGSALESLGIGCGWSRIRRTMAKRAAKRRVASKSRSGSRRRRALHRGRARPASKSNRDAVTLVVQLRPREGQELLLEAELRALLGPTRREDGCLVYDLYRSAEGPAAFMLYEVWASREEHTRHTGTSHFLRWNARKDALLASLDRVFWKRIS